MFDNISKQMKVDVFQKTTKDNIFCVGPSCSSTLNYTNKNLDGYSSDIYSAIQGEIAAYNILSLDIPMHQIPFDFYDFKSFEIKKVGHTSFYNNSYVFGDIEAKKFLIIFSVDQSGN